MRAMKILVSFGLLVAVASLSPRVGGTAPTESAIVPFAMDSLGGAGLTPVPPYNKAVTISGLQKLSARELFNGAFVAFVWASEDGGSMRLVNYPFDQFVQVLSGTTSLTDIGGNTRSFSAGETFVVPRGFNGTWVLSAHYRHLIILEPKQLQAGIGQFE
jgi:uncharacterized cupin superfamily protein